MLSKQNARKRSLRETRSSDATDKGPLFDGDIEFMEAALARDFNPLKPVFPTDIVFEAQLRSALSVDSCSKCAGANVYKDIVNEIVSMVSPRIATVEELDAFNVRTNSHWGADWRKAGIGHLLVAQLEMKVGKIRGEGYYLRAAIAHFGVEKWWQLCASTHYRGYVLGALCLRMPSSGRPNVPVNELILALTIPPSGHPLRKEALLPSNPSIHKHYLTAIIEQMMYSKEDNDAVAVLLQKFEKFTRADNLWTEMILWQRDGVIPAVVYMSNRKKADRRIFEALLPNKKAMTDARFWLTNSPRTNVYKRVMDGVVIHQFKQWIGDATARRLLHT